MGLGRSSQFLAVKGAVSRAIDWVLPPVCPVTGDPVDGHGMVSADYWASLRFITRPFCPKCGVPHGFGGVGDGVGADMVCGACVAQPPLFTQARAAVVYDDASRRVVLRFKHGDQVQIVRVLVPWMLRAGGDILAEADFIVPVPLHKWRFLKRRYNQAAILSQSLANAVQKRSIVDALLRVKRTRMQGGLKAEERRNNIKGAIAVNGRHQAALVGARVLLVDDVFTTGATLNECAKTLLDAGVAQVDVLCVARAVKD